MKITLILKIESKDGLSEARTVANVACVSHNFSWKYRKSVSIMPCRNSTSAHRFCFNWFISSILTRGDGAAATNASQDVINSALVTVARVSLGTTPAPWLCHGPIKQALAGCRGHPSPHRPPNRNANKACAACPLSLHSQPCSWPLARGTNRPLNCDRPLF